MNVHHAGVEPGIEEEDAAHDVGVGEDVVLFEVAIEVALSVLCLLPELLLVVPLGLVKGIGEELHVVPCPAHVFLDFLPNDVIFEVLVP